MRNKASFLMLVTSSPEHEPVPGGPGVESPAHFHDRLGLHPLLRSPPTARGCFAPY